MNTFFPEIKKNFGFGLMRLPVKSSKIDNEQLCQMVDLFIEQGFNYFDTAHGYHSGWSEKAVKTCLTSRYPRDKYLLVDKLTRANIPRMVITLGAEGAVHAELGKDSGYCPSHQLEPIDTTGAGDAFFTGVAIGLTYGKSLAEACRIGTRLATSVILTRESVCPRFRPEEFGLPNPKQADETSLE